MFDARREKNARERQMLYARLGASADVSLFRYVTSLALIKMLLAIIFATSPSYVDVYVAITDA